MQATDAEYELLSSTRFDPFLRNLRWNDDNDEPSPFLLLRYHFDRLLAATQSHNWDAAKSFSTFDDFKTVCHHAVATANRHEDGSQALKLRFTLSRSGQLRVTTSPVPTLGSDPSSAASFDPSGIDPSPSDSFGPVYSVVLDSVACPSSIFTSTKTTCRSHYDNARRRAQLPPLTRGPPAEVLLYNEEGRITEASISNVAFYRGDQWLTPSLSTGCLSGVFRRWLLEQGLIYEDKEGHLIKGDIKEGEWVLLFNAVTGCRLGKIEPSVVSLLSGNGYGRHHLL
ncbi:hypothetical protein H0H93_011413 [Arthromyces matolae]|nr:hypothetical protein H0H93_011413 [Arthromyces matolae]